MVELLVTVAELLVAVDELLVAEGELLVVGNELLAVGNEWDAAKKLSSCTGTGSAPRNACMPSPGLAAFNLFLQPPWASS